MTAVVSSTELFLFALSPLLNGDDAEDRDVGEAQEEEDVEEIVVVGRAKKAAEMINLHFVF